jgi:hypothetical protein
MLRIVSAASNALANSSLKMVVRKEPIQDRLWEALLARAPSHGWLEEGEEPLMLNHAGGKLLG